MKELNIYLLLWKNDSTGGAPFSQHQYGKAIDIAVGDVDKDGIVDEINDKKVVLYFLENNVFNNTGGIGRYPETDVVHFDTRENIARWDVQ